MAGHLMAVGSSSEIPERNIGTSLVKEMESRLQSIGCKRIILLSDKDNSAINFYQKLGYIKDSNVCYMEKNILTD